MKRKTISDAQYLPKLISRKILICIRYKVFLPITIRSTAKIQIESGSSYFSQNWKFVQMSCWAIERFHAIFNHNALSSISWAPQKFLLFLVKPLACCQALGILKKSHFFVKSSVCRRSWYLELLKIPHFFSWYHLFANLTHFSSIP